MHPEIFGMVKSFGLLLSLSFLAGIALCLRRGRRRGLDDALILDLCFAVLLSSLAGVRLFYVLAHPGDFQPWYRVFFIWEGGLVLYGGILLATATVWWLCRRRGVPFLVMADVMAPAVALGIGLTRIGCFLNGCCFGVPTHLPWGVRFPSGSAAAHVFGHAHIHPVQIYSSLAGFAVFALLLLGERRPGPAGRTFARFLALYGVTRFGEDLVRYYEPQMYIAQGLTNNQAISLLLLALGSALLLRLGRRPIRGD